MNNEKKPMSKEQQIQLLLHAKERLLQAKLKGYSRLRELSEQ